MGTPMRAEVQDHALGERLRGDLLEDVAQFLYDEADLLDSRRFDEWYALFTDDIRYWMPIRYNVGPNERDRELAADGELAHFDEDHRSLGWRVHRLANPMAWAENPPSRTRHLVANVSAWWSATPGEIAARSNIVVYRNRRERDVDVWAGQRWDLLRVTERDPLALRIARRTIILDQSVITAQNLSVFF